MEHCGKPMWRDAIWGVDPEEIGPLETVWWSCTAKGCNHKVCEAGHVLVLPHEVTWRPYLDTAKGLPSAMFKDLVAKGRVVTLEGGEVMVRRFAPGCREGACLEREDAWEAVRYEWNRMNREQRVWYVLAVRAGTLTGFPLAAEDFWPVAQLVMPDSDWDAVIEYERPWNPDWDE